MAFMTHMVCWVKILPEFEKSSGKILTLALPLRSQAEAQGSEPEERLRARAQKEGT